LAASFRTIALLRNWAAAGWALYNARHDFSYLPCFSLPDPAFTSDQQFQPNSLQGGGVALFSKATSHWCSSSMAITATMDGPLLRQGGKGAAWRYNAE
jgi:hypothetical protein